MSGNPMSTVHEKKIVRFWVTGKHPKSRRKNVDRRYKMRDAAVRKIEYMALRGYTEIGIWQNTKTFKTERLL